MIYAVEIGSGAMKYVRSFVKISSRIQKLIWGDTHTHRQHGDRISVFLFFQNKESRLMNWKGFRRKRCGLVEVQSQNLSGRTRGNHERAQ
jgi:hypothetical protein